MAKEHTIMRVEIFVALISYIPNPIEVHGENVSNLRAGVRIPVDPTDFV
jgi:hypothetical protein